MEETTTYDTAPPQHSSRGVASADNKESETTAGMSLKT